jgi:hypothetical protein
MIGYKAFQHDDGKLTTKYGEISKQYCLDTSYEHHGRLNIGYQGYHYCEQIHDIYKYFTFSVAIVKIKVPMDAKVIHKDSNYCTNKFKLLELINGEYKNDQYYLNFRNGLLCSNRDQPAMILYAKNKQVIQMQWRMNGRCHRDGDNPAWIQYNEKNQIIEKQWWYKGRPHRDEDKPVIIRYNEYNQIIEEQWMHCNGDRPSIITYNGYDQIIEKQWLLNGKLYRDNDKPAIIKYQYDKIVKLEWYKNGIIDRDGDKPAIIQYRPNQITEQYWYSNGLLHRDGDKPAIAIHWHDQIYVEKWYKNGIACRGGGKSSIQSYYVIKPGDCLACCLPCNIQ